MDRETATALIDALGARDGIVATVGAGGKKSTLYRLLEAHRAIGTARIALTSTVQFATVPKALGVEPLIIEADNNTAIKETLGKNGAFLFARPSTKPGRLSGLPEPMIADLHERGDFALSLVKADGARMRMIKAPAEQEPAVPAGVSTLLPIVSARVFGRSLDDRLVHRPERLTQVIDADVGAELTPDHVATLLSSPDGALRRAGTAKVVPIINMVDRPERLASAREAALKALSLTERFDHVVLTSMTSPAPLVEVITAGP